MKLKIFKKLKKKAEEIIDKKIEKYAQENISILSKIINRPNEGEIVKINNIQIPYKFTEPNKNKLLKRENYYKKYGYFKSTIVLNKNNVLVDGYTTYLLALNNGYEYITILREE